MPLPVILAMFWHGFSTIPVVRIFGTDEHEDIQNGYNGAVQCGLDNHLRTTTQREHNNTSSKNRKCIVDS